MSFFFEETIEQVRRHPKLVIADDFEIVIQHSFSQVQKFHNGDSFANLKDDSYWVGLRILHRGRPGKSATDTPSKPNLDNLVETAFEAAHNSSGDPWFCFPLWREPSQKSEKQAADDTVISYESLFPKIVTPPQIFEETYETRNTRTHLYRKNERFQLKQEQKYYGLQYSLVDSSQNSVFWLKDNRAYSVPLYDREKWLGGLLEKGKVLRKASHFNGKGKTSFLFSPNVLIELLKKIAPWFYADKVQKKITPLPDQSAHPLFSSVISLIDDGNYEGAAWRAPFDLEGTLTKETVVVDRGVVKSLLYNTYFARRENRLSTGNYLRLPSFTWPQIHASMFYLKPSDESPEDLVGSMSDGVLLDRVDTLESLPASNQKFILTGSGWRVVHGKCVEPICGLSLEVDVFDLFQRAVGVGNDLTLYGCYGAPSVLFENVPLLIERK